MNKIRIADQIVDSQEYRSNIRITNQIVDTQEYRSAHDYSDNSMMASIVDTTRQPPGSGTEVVGLRSDCMALLPCTQVSCHALSNTPDQAIGIADY